MNDVFISYSTLDNKFAFRIYSDLLRSGLKVYLYERDGEIGVKFNEEISHIIQNSKHFCLIDSPNSRKSKWVKEEINIAYKKHSEDPGKFKFIPCFIESTKDSWFREDEHFPNQSSLRGIDFSCIDYLDYKEKYKKAINELCNECGSDFKPWSDSPRDKDFEKEIGSNLTDEQREFLLNDYRNFVFFYSIKSKTSLVRIQNIIEDCEILKIKIISCYLAKGTILADNDEDKKAFEVYKQATIDFPYDARSWAALSASQFYLNNYEESLFSINNSIKIIEENKENDYLQRHYNEMIYNKIQILIELYYIDEAEFILNSLSSHEHLPEFLIAHIRITLIKNEFTIGNRLYRKLSENYYDFNLNSKHINLLIANIEYEIGKKLANIGNTLMAERHYNIATNANKKCIQYFGELVLLKVYNKSWDLEGTLNEGLNLHPISNNDLYFYGLLKFLNNELEAASYYFEQSKKAGWPYYNKLII